VAKPLAVAMGDPAGIGPETIAKAWEARGALGVPPFFAVGQAEAFEQVWGGPARVVADPAETPFAHASLWGVGPPLLPFLDGLNGPPYELAEAFQRAIDAGHDVKAVEVGPTRDLTDPLDLVRENFPYLDRAAE
jgi:hypothetical protein